MTEWIIVIGSLITSALFMLVPVLTTLSFALEWHESCQFMFFIFFVLEYLVVLSAILQEAKND